MPTISAMDILNERNKLEIEHKQMKKEVISLEVENAKLKKDIDNKFNDLVKYEKENMLLKDENKYLLQRLKEMRHKSWFPVYQENLELQEQNKNLDATCNEVIGQLEIVEKELNQYKAVVQSIETFVGRFQDEKR